MPEAQDRSQTVTQQIDALLVEVREQCARTDALYEKIGVRPDDVARYLRSDRVDPTQREQVEQELAALRAEIDSDARQAADLLKSQQSATRVRIAPNRVRI